MNRTRFAPTAAALVLALAARGFAAPTDDHVPPVIEVTSPACTCLSVSTSPLVFEGTAWDDTMVAAVTWFNAATGGGGEADCTTAWTAEVPLEACANEITFTAVDVYGNESSVTVNITLLPTGEDTMPPAVEISGPTTCPEVTSQADTIWIAGTATDETGLVTVVWSNTATGASATANGTGSWSGDVLLESGLNVILVTAYDSSGNAGSDTLTVFYDGSESPPAYVPPGDGGPGKKDKNACGLLGAEVALLMTVLVLFGRETR